MQANIGMAGEFRVVVKRADGSTKIDTGYQKNLILNQGLDFFGGGRGDFMTEYCVIGSGNSQPSYTQNKLDNTVVGVGGGMFSSKTDYDAIKNGNLYTNYTMSNFSFTKLNNVNISEVGLASTYGSPSSYYLCTRALIKDVSGNPTTITVLSGEILEIYYKLWAVFDTTDKTGQINLLNGAGGSVPYKYQARLAKVGDRLYNNTASIFSVMTNLTNLTNDDLSAITTVPSTGLSSYTAATSYESNTYVQNSYKRVFLINFDVRKANAANRVLVITLNNSCWQIRFGSVADDSPITKTSTQTLSIPIEVSWGRYEGAL